MTDAALLLVVQGQLEFLAQELQLLLLQFGHRHLAPSLAGFPQRREDQFQARFLCEEVRDDLGTPSAFLKGTLQQVGGADRLVTCQWAAQVD